MHLIKVVEVGRVFSKDDINRIVQSGVRYLLTELLNMPFIVRTRIMLSKCLSMSQPPADISIITELFGISIKPKSAELGEGIIYIQVLISF